MISTENSTKQVTGPSAKTGKAVNGSKRWVIINSHPIQYFAPLYASLSAKGMDLEVLYCTGEAEKKFDTGFGRALQWDIPLLEGYQHRFLPNFPLQPVASKKMFSLLNPGVISYLAKRKKSTVVIHSWQYATDFLAIVFSKLLGHRIALWTEVNNAHELQQRGLKKLLKSCFFKTLFLFVNEFWCIGSENRQFYLRMGVNPKKLLNTPYAVDNNRFERVARSVSKQAARVRLGLPADAFIVLYSGKYIHKKRPLDLLQAFTKIADTGARLVLVGEGSMRPQLEQYISDNGLKDRILLTGFVNQSEIPLYYRAADLFVMCSGVGETWGLSVNEAMNFGLPLLISHLTGCSKDLVEAGKNGFVFETGNVAELSSRLMQMTALPGAALNAMGQHSLELIRRHSYEAIYRGIMEGANSY